MNQNITESSNNNDNVCMSSSEMAIMRKEIENVMENMFTDPHVS